MSDIFSLVVSCVAIILSIFSLIGSIVAVSFVIGFKNSTHQIQIVDPSAPTGEELAKEFDKMEKNIDKGVMHV